MCGIAGTVGRAPNRGAMLDAMHRAIAHRGPDDRGAWQSKSCLAAFVHTRLSIIDPSPGGHQPMQLGDGRFTIIYNGEIYNFAALRAELIGSGIAFRSTSDTEVILRLFERDGPACVDRLRGMFAFAIWDERERTCFLARDRFGIKPLYFHESGGTLTFASEVRALLAAGISPVVDATAAYHYFRSGSVPEPLTLIHGVRALEAGHYLMWRDSKATMRRYWEVSFPEPRRMASPEVVVRDAFTDSVKHHFVSDVPVGVFLSGGMDSTAIVATAHRLGYSGLRTFSLTFPGWTNDEGPEARRTADHFKTTHHEWALDAATGRQLFDDFVAVADQPSIDGFNTYTVCRLARRHDTKVVLSGLGGDELFGGYPSFRKVPQLARLAKVAQLTGPLGTIAARTAARFGPSRLRRLPDLLTAPASLDSAYAMFRGVFAADEARTLSAHYVGSDISPETAVVARGAETSDGNAISRLELTRYMRNQLLRDADIMSMASGVELRVPFLDPVLFDRVSGIAASARLLPGKALLQRALPELPDWVTGRAKRGFMLPMQQWLEQDWAGTMTLPVPPRSVAVDSWYRKWSLLAFEHWLRRVRPDHA